MDQPRRTLHKLKPEAEGGETTAAAMFECGGGDLAMSAAFDDFPPPDVLAKLLPLEICPVCFPAEAAAAAARVS